jgi:hypothetical protein
MLLSCPWTRVVWSESSLQFVIERKYLTRIERVVASETQLGKRSSGDIAACLAYTCQFGKQEMEKLLIRQTHPGWITAKANAPKSEYLC